MFIILHACYKDIFRFFFKKKQKDFFIFQGPFTSIITLTLVTKGTFLVLQSVISGALNLGKIINQIQIKKLFLI
jgi:hypothetical protein